MAGDAIGLQLLLLCVLIHTIIIGLQLIQGYYRHHRATLLPTSKLGIEVEDKIYHERFTPFLDKTSMDIEVIDGACRVDMLL